MTDLLVILILFFLFWGEPDVWDKLHERAMQHIEEPQCVKQSSP
jgi:hypothetical protein